MAHTTKDKPRMLRRVAGFGDRWQRSNERSTVRTNAPACFSSWPPAEAPLNGLMAEVLEGHIRFHVLNPKSGKNAPQREAAEELIEVVRTYLK